MFTFLSFRCVAPLGLLAALAAGATAADVPLTLDAALARVEAGHPWLRSRDVEARLAEARVAAAQTRPPGEISLDFENVLGTGELRAAHALETTLQFGRVLESATLRGARTDAAHGLSEVERAAWEERQRALLSEAARRFIAVAAGEADDAAAEEAVALATQTENAARARLEQAAGSPVDVARAHHARIEIVIEAEHAEHVLLAARQGLATMWGAATPDFAAVAADLTTLPPVAPFEALAAKLADTPAQARFAALVRWRRAQENLARATGARGQPRWSAGIRRVELTDDWGFVLGLGYALPQRGFADAHAAESRAERERLEIEAETARLDARQLLYELYQELGHARVEFTAAREELIPSAQAWLDGAEAGFRAGRFALRDVLEAQAALLESRRHQLGAAAEYHLTLVAIESLLGTAATTNP